MSKYQKMTVAELIAELEQVDRDALVRTEGCDGCHGKYLQVAQGVNVGDIGEDGSLENVGTPIVIIGRGDS